MYGATKNTGVYYLTVSELMSGEELRDTRIRVNGQVIDGSIKWYLKNLASGPERVYEFTITDGEKNLVVNYEESLPDTFGPGIEVVAEGIYSKDGIFKAEKVIAKCPSKYEVE